MRVNMRAFIIGTFAVNLVTLYLVFLFVPPEATLGDLYRIMYLHVPAAWVAYLAFGVTLVGSVLFLKKKDYGWDLTADASARLGIVFTSLALVLGSLWAGSAWGSYWNWDPRETMTLVLWLMYVAYLSFRISIEDREKRARLSSVIGILAFITVPMSYLSVQLWLTLHPVVVRPSGIMLEPSMVMTLMISLVGLTMLYTCLLIITRRALEIEDRIEAIKYR